MIGSTPEPATRLRRTLDRAALSSPSPGVLRAMTVELERPLPQASACADLPATLARVVGLPGGLIFRHNTTLAVRDLLLAELLAGPGTAQAPGRLLCTDAEHPAVRQVVGAIWPSAAAGGGIVELPLRAALLDGTTDAAAVSAQLGQALEAALAGGAAVLLLPHVVWFNGARLDVVALCRQARARSPGTLILLDGAQAVGHVSLPPALWGEELVDAYVGCTHKWLGGPQTLGFVDLGPRLRQDPGRRAAILASGDILPELGALRAHQGGLQCGTQRRSVAAGSLQALVELDAVQGGLPAVALAMASRASALRARLRELPGLGLLGPPRGTETAMVALRLHGGDEASHRLLAQRLDAAGYTPARYALDGRGSFLRLSPGPHLLPAEQDEVVALVAEAARQSLRPPATPAEPDARL